MPHDITNNEPLAHRWMGYYRPDRVSSDAQRVAERIIDITDVCPRAQELGRQVVAKYASDFQGLEVQVQIRFPVGVDTGSGPTFFPERDPMIDTHPFIHLSQIVGCEVARFAQTLTEFAPSSHSDVLEHMEPEQLSNV